VSLKSGSAANRSRHDVGACVGIDVGVTDGDAEGAFVGVADGDTEGFGVGDVVGAVHPAQVTGHLDFM
jgi:hypothetical protein